jgi:hypothetical protein
MKIKLITQFICKSQDQSFKSNYSMIEQYLSNKNKSATVSFSKKNLKLNKASGHGAEGAVWEFEVLK